MRAGKLSLFVNKTRNFVVTRWNISTIGIAMWLFFLFPFSLVWRKKYFIADFDTRMKTFRVIRLQKAFGNFPFCDIKNNFHPCSEWCVYNICVSCFPAIFTNNKFLYFTRNSNEQAQKYFSLFSKAMLSRKEKGNFHGNHIFSETY